MARGYFVGGNFKMNGSKELVTKLITNMKEQKLNPAAEIVLGVPAPYLDLASQLAKGSKIQIAGENCYLKDSGAFTGEVSPSMLKDTGANWVILGHSERRHIFKEDDELIAAKAKFALDQGLKVIYCIGELKEEREAGKAQAVNSAQLESLSKVISHEDWSRVVIAYEPVWAIGTGLTATPADAQEIHHHLRKDLARLISPACAEQTMIIYGGSVTGLSCGSLSKEADVDGFLVGGASLKPEFIDIVNVNVK